MTLNRGNYLPKLSAEIEFLGGVTAAISAIFLSIHAFSGLVSMHLSVWCHGSARAPRLSKR
jgi:hypothetical protein